MGATDDINQKKTAFHDDVLLSRDVSLGSGDNPNKIEQKIISAAIQRFRRLKQSNSQYLRRLVALKQQVNSLPDGAAEKSFIYDILLNSVYEYDGSTRILSWPTSKSLSKKLNKLKISPTEITDRRYANPEEWK
ncbi:hypothetical protein HNY73_000911 [Argiope bruennichi]|uniref:Uncharacterized protein n=1 Tax=Argiope bruennichi TaxID=94029 RepID=A0A8T0FZU4_ARGBR|nr:hypothetical protein HNY73_000911 [Argiope bruennichi]